MVEAFLWGLLATSSLVIGALVVQNRPPSERVLGTAMAFDAGVLISAVSFELIQEADEVSGGSGGTAAGLFAGAIVFAAGDFAISKLGARSGAAERLIAGRSGQVRQCVAVETVSPLERLCDRRQ